MTEAAYRRRVIIATVAALMVVSSSCAAAGQHWSHPRIACVVSFVVGGVVGFIGGFRVERSHHRERQAEFDDRPKLHG